MKALVIYCHPKPDSFTSAVKDQVIEVLSEQGAETRLVDLYGEDFNPIIYGDELVTYLDTDLNQRGLEDHIENLLWCDTLIFVYPTWWYGLPAMLKGWLDRCLLPGVAFHMPEGDKGIKPGLRHITRLGLFTTAGATPFATYFMGAPGKRTILRAIKYLCKWSVKRVFLAHYSMDTSTPESRSLHLQKVRKKMKKFVS